MKRSLTLAARMVLLSAGMSGALAIGLTWLGYQNAASGLRKKSELALGSEAAFGASLVDGWMSGRIVALKGVASVRSVRRVLETATALANEDVDAANQALADLASVAPEIESIDVIDPHGAVVAGTTSDEGGKHLLTVEHVRRAFAGDVHVSGVSVSPSSGQPCVYVAVPAYGSNGTVVGVVRSRESIARIRDLVQGIGQRIGSGAQAVLLDGDGLVMAATADSTWTLRPAAALSPDRAKALLANGSWGKSAAPAAIGADELRAAVAAPGRSVFSWQLAGTTYVTVSDRLPRSRWTYAAALTLASVESGARSFLRRAIAGAALGLVVASLLSLVVARRVVRSVRRLIDASTQIVAENDLTHTIEVVSDDEVGQLAASFSRMVEALRAALITLQTASQSLLQASDELGSNIDTQSELLARNSAALQQVQTTAQEIKQVSELTALKANSVLQAAEGADAIGNTGAAAIDDTLNGLAAIRARSTDVGERIQLVAERARQIGGITDTVKELADQSNMLALNAAIEAARSGEQGKGFGVVAREIRSLADQSIEATNRVREILADLGHSIGSAVQMSEQGARSIEAGLSHVKNSGEGLRGLVAIARGNVEAARQIAAAVGQQDAGIQQLFVAMTDQVGLMDQTRSRLERTTLAAQGVREEARRVSTLLARYRL